MHDGRSWPADKVERRNIETLIPYARNSRTHSDEQITQIASSIKEWGFTNPILVDAQNEIIAGHGRLLAAKKLNLKEVPCIQADDWTEAQKKAYVIADNKLALNAGWDEELLKVEFNELTDLNFNLELTGFSLDELGNLFDEKEEEINRAGNLTNKFLAPPFSVLNSRDGWWQDRKKKWIELGIESEEGRDDDLTFNNNIAEMAGMKISNTSVFDPVLCELVYRWFCPKNGNIVDPFAGGSVRGIIASKLEKNYFGHELRSEQVESNRKQSKLICENFLPIWEIGDSININKTFKDVKADLIFSCPPYVDLEVYSDDKNDLSNMDYNSFLVNYKKIIEKSCSLLNNDAFACFVVGEVRDKKGYYYNFVGETINAFLDSGLKFYNEAILVTMVGSLPLRAGKGFSVSRKLGKTHQNVLVFVKGDPRVASEKCGEVEVDLSGFDDE